MIEDIETVLKGHKEYPLIRSVRHKPKSSPNPETKNFNPQGTLKDPIFRKGYSLLKKYKLHFDLQTPWWHLNDAASLAKDFPDTIIILNHGGLPSDRTYKGLENWKANMEELAEQPNVAVKISGICVPKEKWTVQLNRQVVLDIIEIFGYERCMFASNFPVDSILASFDEIYDGFKKITNGMKKNHINALFHDNAIKYYNPL